MYATVKNAIDGFKGAPGCLAAVLLVGGFAYFVYTGREAEAVRAHERFMTILKQCDFIPETHGREDADKAK